jgi:hypothetical protein
MNATTVRSASVDRDPIGDPSADVHVAHAGRILGGGVAAVVAIAATLIAATLNGGWFLGLGIPAASVTGWYLGPGVRSDSWSLRPTIGMATLTIGLADAFAVVVAMLRWDGGYAAQSVDLISATAFTLFTSVVTWLLGLIVVGLLSLAVTIPCAVIWAFIVRSLIGRGIGAAHDGQRPKS